MICIYSNQLTNRTNYIFRLLFETILGETVASYADVEQYTRSSGIKINYSDNSQLEGLQLLPHPLLFEKGIKPQNIEVDEWNSLKIFFKTDHSFLPFDIFAASFYLVTRYEEYFPGKRDRHNRFLSRNSIASQHHFLEKPLINCWAWEMASIIEARHEDFQFKKSKFNYMATIDIDNAWAFKNKGFIRNSASAMKDLLSGRINNVGNRLSVIFSKKEDPYDTYDFIHQLTKTYNLRPLFFILMNKKGKHDHSLSYKNKTFQKLIRSLDKWGEAGIHPSYSSNKNDKTITREISKLAFILGRNVKISRQHYLKLSLPQTYKRLISNGIEADYTMGYASRPGFRASICTPHHFFDLTEETEKTLTIVPFEVMDGTLRHYRNLSPADALKKIKSLIFETAMVGGTFVSLWHNESLSNKGEWEDWRQVYTEMTRMAVELSK